MPVFEFSLKKRSYQKWYVVEAQDEQSATVRAKAEAAAEGMRLYAGPLTAKCRYCDEPAVTMAGRPAPWAKVCLHHKNRFPGY